MRIAAYVYPGWHPIPERDAAFHPGFTEWELVASCRPRFEGHAQPRVPLLGTYDDRDPAEVGRRVRLAVAHGVDAFVYGFFWCRGKRVFQDALDVGFLGGAGDGKGGGGDAAGDGAGDGAGADAADAGAVGVSDAGANAPVGATTPFAVMWANRMPRRVLPVRRADLPVIDAARLVPSDVDDFVALVAYVAERYFRRPNYVTVGGRPYFSIFDATFFVKELGFAAAADAVRAARAWLAANGLPDMHLAAIDPAPDVTPHLRAIGFDSVTHYVFLPDWKGPFLQDYATYALRRSQEWSGFAERSGLPYMPSVAPGWDASPRGADFGPARPDKYPWSPVVVGEHPDRFHEALARAVRFAMPRVGRASAAPPDDPLVFVASLNEWSEGHHLEPDTRFGMQWLEAVRAAR